MERCEYFMTTFWWLIPLIAVATLWDVTWKLIAMWKAAQNKQAVWFVCIAIFNTLGILPIIYLLLDKRKATKP